MFMINLQKNIFVEHLLKSHLVSIWIALLMGVAWILPILTPKAHAQEKANDGKTKTIVILRYRIAPNAFSTTVKGLKEALDKRGYSEGKNVNYIDVLTPTADARSVPVVLDAVRNHLKDADVFVTCGWISMYARTILKNTGTPQFFCPVLKSVALKMLDSVATPPKTNLSGVYLMYPPEKLLRISRLILPSARRYGYIFDSRIPADMVFKAACEALPPEKHHGFHMVYIDITNGPDEIIKSLTARPVDVYGGIVGAFRNRKALNVLNIPMVTALTLDIEKKEISKYLKKDNTIAGLFNPFSYCGKEVGEMIADIFDKKATIYNIIPRPAQQIAFLNLRAARRLGIFIPFEALEAVDLVVK